MRASFHHAGGFDGFASGGPDTVVLLMIGQAAMSIIAWRTTMAFFVMLKTVPSCAMVAGAFTIIRKAPPGLIQNY
jgi:hypothetical protein